MIHTEINWNDFNSIKPNADTEILMYRNDCGVFFGYYGSLEQALPEDAKQNCYDSGMTEDEMFDNRFYYYDMMGNGLLELDTLPTFWAEKPNLLIDINQTK